MDAKLSEEEKSRRAANRRRKAALAAEEDAIHYENKQREWKAREALDPGSRSGTVRDRPAHDPPAPTPRPRPGRG